MFGYIKPYNPELKMKEYDLYKSAYCGLCKVMGKNYGILARFALSFDATFLAMFLLSAEGCSKIKDGKCVFNPFKRCKFCEDSRDILAFSGAVTVIMAYYKLKDDIKDSSFWGKLKSYFVMAVAHRSYKKAKKKFLKIDEIVYENMLKQNLAESNPKCSIDNAAFPTSNMLSEILKLMSNGSNEQDKIYDRLGFFVGRWIYLIDAVDDLEKDIKHKNFNPFIPVIETFDYDKNKPPLFDERIRNYCNETLNQTVSQIILSYNLLRLKCFDSIIKNILYLGFADMQKQVIFDKLNTKKYN